MKIRDLGEFGLIDLLSRRIPAPSARVLKGIGDDTAVLKPDQGKLILMTTDMLVEDIHFSLLYTPFRSVGWKALAVNVSDIAAMGGLPTAATVSIGIPPRLAAGDAEEIYLGLGECAEEYGVDIVGGDTVKSPDRLVINITLLGEADPDRVVYRSGARPGDLIMVTGPLGASAAGLYALNNKIAAGEGLVRDPIQAHLFPRARIREGRALAQSGYVTSINDISDGLASEILEICRASGAGCKLDAEAVPYTVGIANMSRRAGVTPLRWALYGGEDFELVFTVKPGGADAVRAVLKEIGSSPVTVGMIVNSDQGCVLIENGRKTELVAGGYDHFRE